METEKNEEGGSPRKVTRPIITETPVKKTFSHCPECQGELRFGSRDLAEGDYWWCSVCGYGPILFPLFCGPEIKQITNTRELLGIIDADLVRANADIHRAAAAIQKTMFADRKPFDPAKSVRDLVGS